MERRSKLWVRELGRDVEFLFTTWHDDWLAIKDTPVGNLLVSASQEVVDHAYRRYTRPLVDALGPDPQGCLIKLPKQYRRCYQQARECPIRTHRCELGHKEMPWCYEPAGVEDEAVRRITSRVIATWHEGVYIVVIE